MHRYLINSLFFVAATGVLSLPACGDNASTDGANDAGANGDTGASDTGGTTDTGAVVDMAAPPDDGGEMSDTGGTSDMAPVDTGGTGDSVGTPDVGIDATGSCSVWEITYDLAGSEFEISNTPLGAGNQVNTVAEPYDANDHVGPGTMTIRFRDMSGAPGGLAAIHSYTMAIHFLVDSITDVATDLDATAGPEACGITTGTLNGSTVAWTPSALVATHTVGQIVCTGALCGIGGMPNGQPVPVDETIDQPISDFVFGADLSTFTMAKTVNSKDSTATTSWTYNGTETSRQLISAPACLCP